MKHFCRETSPGNYHVKRNSSSISMLLTYEAWLSKVVSLQSHGERQVKSYRQSIYMFEDIFCPHQKLIQGHSSEIPKEIQIYIPLTIVCEIGLTVVI